MQGSHVADDFAAIARRLKELQDEDRRAEEHASAAESPRVWMGYPTARAPRPREEPRAPGYR